MQPATAINEVFSICPNQLLGKGSTGDVYLGFYNGQPNRRVAIKQIDLASINNEVTQYLLSCEIAALSNLGKLQNTAHQNIVKLIDIVISHNTMYLILQLLEGGTLAEYIKKHPQGLPVDEAMHIFRQILEGYQRIKNRQIIHRDLKPDNILFKHQSGRTVAIIDFGYCTMQEVPKKPQVFYNVGSPKYMSPQAYKENKYSEKSDIWAIGVMLYEMLVGHTCDKGLSMEAYLDMLQRQGVPIPQKVNGFQHFLLTNMLSYNHHHRFDCDHILQELRNNAGGEPSRNSNILVLPGSPLQQNLIHSHQLKVNQQPNQHMMRVQNVQMSQTSTDFTGRQNSLLNLRSSLNDADLVALRANRPQPLFHSVMLPEQHPLFKIDRNLVPERGLRSESKINDQNENTPAENSQRVISFHEGQKKPREEAAAILGRVQNVDLNSVRQIVHRRHPDWMFQSKINNSPHPQPLIKQSNIAPLHPQELRQQFINAQSQYMHGSKPTNPNEQQQPFLIQQIRPQKINNQMKSAHILISPTPRNEQVTHSQGPHQLELNPFFSTNNCTPKASQPQNLQMSVYHPPMHQINQQSVQMGPRTQQPSILQKDAEMPNFKKVPSSGQLVINLSQQYQARQEQYSNRPQIEIRARAINKDLTATRIPDAQRFSHKEQPQQRSINPQIRHIQTNSHQQQFGKVLSMRPQTNIGRNFVQINSNTARFDVIPVHLQPQLSLVRQAVIK